MARPRLSARSRRAVVSAGVHLVRYLVARAALPAAATTILPAAAAWAVGRQLARLVRFKGRAAYRSPVALALAKVAAQRPIILLPIAARAAMADQVPLPSAPMLLAAAALAATAASSSRRRQSVRRRRW